MARIKGYEIVNVMCVLERVAIKIISKLWPTRRPGKNYYQNRFGDYGTKHNNQYGNIGVNWNFLDLLWKYSGRKLYPYSRSNNKSEWVYGIQKSIYCEH